MLFSYVNRIDKCIFRRSWAPLWPETTTWWGAFLQEVAWRLQRLPPFMMAWFWNGKVPKAQRPPRPCGSSSMVASKAEAIAMGVDKVQGSSFERGEDLGWLHTTVIFQKYIYIIQSLKVPLTILALTFEKEMQTFWCSFQLVALTLSLSLWKRMLLSHLWRPTCSKGLLEIGNHYPTTSWPNKAYLVSNCPWCLCRAFHTWRLLIWSLSWWQKSGASRPVALRNFYLKRLGKMISLISL